MEAIKDVIINFIYTRYDIIIPCLWAIAVISPFIGIVWWTIRRSRKKISNFVVTITVCVLISVFLMRFGVGYYNNVSVDNGLPLPEVAGQCLIETFQTLTLDAGHEEYIKNIKDLMGEIFDGAGRWVQTFYLIFVYVLNIGTPILGGTILFDILASIFPKIRLWFLTKAVFRPKYYFSELNSDSLELAKSICSVKPRIFRRPVIIFTDVYANKEDEGSSEVLTEAKMLGAICINDDLSHVKKNWLGKRKFILIDADEKGNLQALADLVLSGNQKYLKKAEVYIFTNDDAYVQIENRINDTLNSKFKNPKHRPSIIPVQSYRNLVSNLLVEVPLYEPLIGKKRNKDGRVDLNVTILGTGQIGMEMFLSTYWFGQILNCNLNITVLSQEEETEFYGKLDYINPEIRRTMTDGDPILCYNKNGDMSEKYCNVKYIQCDVKSSKFIECLSECENSILRSDYFFVSLGADEINIEIADIIRRYVGEYHIARFGETKSAEGNSTQKPDQLRSVIAYVVYDSDVSNTLNGKKHFSHIGGYTDIYMCAIGSLQEVYSVKNVFLEEYRPFAENIHAAYMSAKNLDQRAKKHKKDRMLKTDYQYWSNLSRAMHTKYRAYALGIIPFSLLDFQDEEEYRALMAIVAEKYDNIARGNVDFATEADQKKHIQRIHEVAWMEHRRWNAFTRIKGFRHTSAYDKYGVSGKLGSYKQMDIKLHPCLVECSKNGIQGTISFTGVVDKESLLKEKNEELFDLLDELAYKLYKAKLNDYDFKYYDYICSEIPSEKKNKTKPKKNSEKKHVGDTYIPTPIDTNDIEFPNDLLALKELLAENVHENWAKGRIDQGWTYGKKRNDKKKKTPCLVQYSELDESEKNYDRNTAFETLKTIIKLGYEIEKTK